MYAGVADIAGGILFTDGVDYSDTKVGDAFFDFDGDRLGRIRYDSPMFGRVRGSASYGQDDQWAAAVTLGGDYGDWSGWTVGDFTLLAAASVYNTEDDNVDYACAAGSYLHDPTGAQPYALDRRLQARRRRRSLERLRQGRLGHLLLAARTDRLRR
ncbi:hypothetical protein [Amaricoccus sp.]|uniref:hypothetical protein n=1 Tax=Amaricoccus sp. TaxID=1872485 RepID=UPI001B5B0528|nr:hypothetical protein [Amaricoccus sp.]MBP7243234.1 hypothetical protein [Amaricoccus sp.]